MNREAIALERASGHCHPVNPAMRNCYCYNLWAESWEFRKTDCLELNFFAMQKAFAQITQGKAKPKPRKCPTWLNFNFFGHILVILTDVCAGDSSQKIHCELPLRLSMFRFFPGPFFLNQLCLLPKL